MSHSIHAGRNNGRTTSAAASDGSTYRYFRQERKNQCGPAAVATLFNLKMGREISVSTVGEWYIEGEGTVNVNHDNIRDFQAAGSWYNGTIAALGKLKLYMHATKGFANAGKWVAKGQAKPAILSIGWYQQNGAGWKRAGGHWVVAVKLSGQQVICLDPDHGTGVVEFSTADPNRYDVDYGNGYGVQTGWIDGIILP